jgi:hypothetical protein
LRRVKGEREGRRAGEGRVGGRVGRRQAGGRKGGREDGRAGGWKVEGEESDLRVRAFTYLDKSNRHQIRIRGDIDANITPIRYIFTRAKQTPILGITWNTTSKKKVRDTTLSPHATYLQVW